MRTSDCGVAADEVLIEYKGVTSTIPLAERLEIVRSDRFVYSAIAAATNDKVEIWRTSQFDVLFKGDDWRGTRKGLRLEREFSALCVDVVYFNYCTVTSSSALRPTLRTIDPYADLCMNAAHGIHRQLA